MISKLGAIGLLELAFCSSVSVLISFFHSSWRESLDSLLLDRAGFCHDLHSIRRSFALHCVGDVDQRFCLSKKTLIR